MRDRMAEQSGRGNDEASEQGTTLDVSQRRDVEGRPEPEDGIGKADAERIEAEEVQALGQRVVYELQMRGFLGPLPSPEVMAGYARLDPDLPGRITQMAEEEGRHRRWMEQNGLRWEYRERLMGLVIGGLVSALIIGCATYTALQGQPIAGGVIGTGGIVGIAAVFVYGSRRKAQEKAGEEES